ncbi:thioesterase II family protein [Streptomyces omiyaensis]|uniref:Thioesterase II family protein n=1 Tax=Streptomyces omiyaensis TaxID=68247 RepID=A0ABW7C6H6_9ACTN|nr:alpha/beta fold hydrolase [Streptomyces omiyaensis]GGY84610.1 thioesterase [Streptomyces omiyaensis]
MNSIWFRRFAAAPGPAFDGHPVTKLVCFPHAGGSASSYLPLARGLSGRLDVLAVQYPGRQDRRQERPFTDIHALADAVAEELRPLTGEPYALFGHSMGALLAYETLRRLAGGGAPAPRRLFVSGRGAPGPRANVHDALTTDAQVLTAVRALGGTGAGVLDDPELREMVMPALRADYRALGAYRWPGAVPLSVPVTALVGDADPVVSVDAVAGWSDRTDGPFDLRVFPGGHFYLDAHTPEIADLVVTGLLAGADV